MPLKTTKLFFKPILKFIKTESFSGVILLVCAVISMLLANSNLQSYFFELLKLELLSLSLLHWINDGLMTIFFFVVGLEIKREIVVGELSSFNKALLPISAALGGMVVPALIYLYFNHSEGNLNGWAIPMATDIAFALGILSLFGKKVPLNLKIFLLALAVVDDLGAILVIAFFYTDKIQFGGLAIAFGSLLLVYFSQKVNIRIYFIYIIWGILLWVGFLYSGVHATVAGVILGLITPLKLHSQNSNLASNSPIDQLIHFLHPIIGYFIMPVFALANAGVSLGGNSFEKLFENPVSLGVAAGLVLGKPIGIGLFSFIVMILKLAELPRNVTFLQFFGMSCLAGIGFTMSIFIASLSLFGSELNIAKFGILSGSILSGIIGSVLLAVSIRKTHLEKF